MRLPHEVSPLLRALCGAFKGLLDSHATLIEKEEMYAVFEEKSTAAALSILSIGLSRLATRLTVSAEEQSHKILIRVSGERRTAGGALSYRDLLPKREKCRLALEGALAANCMMYELKEDGHLLSLTVSLPRFLADRYDVCAVNNESICNIFYDMMLFLSGDTPKNPLPL